MGLVIIIINIIIVLDAGDERTHKKSCNIIYRTTN